MVNKKDDWHHERRIGEAVKAGIKCFCGGETYRDTLEVTMNGEVFPCVHRLFCPNCGLQMRSPAVNDEDFIVRQWRDISDLHQHRKEERAIPAVDAVPVDWLDEQIHGYAARLQSTELKALLIVKGLWEKDQEGKS